jgi:hypothetical protein
VGCRELPGGNAVPVAAEGGVEVPVYAVLRVMDSKGKREVGQGLVSLRKAMSMAAMGGGRWGRVRETMTVDVTSGGRWVGTLSFLVQVGVGEKKERKKRRRQGRAGWGT